MCAKCISKVHVLNLSVNLRGPVCLAVLLIIGALAGTSVGDCNPGGTWEITSSDGTTTRNIDCIGTVTGTSEVDLNPGLPCVLTYNISAPITFNPSTCCFGYHWEGRKTCVSFDVNYTEDVTGCSIGCDIADGNTSWVIEVYYDGILQYSQSDTVSWAGNRISVPAAASDPSPPNGATDQPIDVDLSWTNCGGCTFDVYFGTSNPPVELICSDVNEPTCELGTLSYETTYYWRVNSKNTNGTTTGDVWDFTTGVNPNLPPVIESVSAFPSYILDNQTSLLEVVASDPDSGPLPLSYNWIIQPGEGSLDDYNIATPVYTPPDVTGPDQTFSITVEVSDGSETSSSSVDVNVIDINSITCDFYQDWYIDFVDFAILASYWVDAECTDPNWCEGTDVDHSGSTDILELSIFVERWLSEMTGLNLVAYWPLDENDSNTFVMDISGNGHNGTATVNTSLLSAPGQVNTCFDFAGTDAVEINDNAAYSFDDSGTAPFSVAAWIYNDGSANHQTIVSKWKGGLSHDREWSFLLRNNGLLDFALNDDTNGAEVVRRSDDALAVGWWFVVATYTGTGGASAADLITLYVDGVAIDATSFTSGGTYSSMVDTATKVRIGAQLTAVAALVNIFQDKIDDVLLFSKCLTAIEVLSLYSM